MLCFRRKAEGLLSWHARPDGGILRLLFLVRTPLGRGLILVFGLGLVRERVAGLRISTAVVNKSIPGFLSDGTGDLGQRPLTQVHMESSGAGVC
jgi:hypothetical protein